MSEPGKRDEMTGALVDLRSGEARAIQVGRTRAGLEIADGLGTVIARWHVDDMRLVAQVRPGQTVRFSHVSEPFELRLRNGPFVMTLRTTADHLRRAGGMRSPWRVIWAYLGASVAVVVILLVLALEVLPGPVAEALPTSFAERMGEDTYERVFGSIQSCDSGAGTEALAHMVSELWRHSPRQDVQPLVSVVNLRDVNAVALPGGRIIVFRGLLEKAKSPEALAGVIAHEMGHVIEKHGMKNYVRATGVSLALGILTSGSAERVGTFGDLGGLLALMSYSREAESEADAWAVKMLTSSGLPTIPLADLMLGFAEGASGIPLIARSHPDPIERSRSIRSADKGHGSVLSPGQWKALRKICAGKPRPKRLFG